MVGFLRSGVAGQLSHQQETKQNPAGFLNDHLLKGVEISTIIIEYFPWITQPSITKHGRVRTACFTLCLCLETWS